MTGVIIQATDKAVVIDLGSEHHVAIGQDYMVYETGAALVHPVTNLEIGKECKEIAIIRITKVDQLSATAVIVKGQIDDVVPGLQVKKLFNLS